MGMKQNSTLAPLRYLSNQGTPITNIKYINSSQTTLSKYERKSSNSDIKATWSTIFKHIKRGTTKTRYLLDVYHRQNGNYRS